MKTHLKMHMLPLWLVVFQSVAIGATKPPRFSPPRSYYLALGDSITYGFQRSKWYPGVPASAFSTGYVDHFASRLRQIQPGIVTLNYGCPGETTYSFIHDPCGWAQSGELLHDSFSGTQLDAAVAFLVAHPGEVSPITITLWSNDVRLLVASCPAGDVVCIGNKAPEAIQAIDDNLTHALQRLREAAPKAEIIVTGAWDGFIGAFDFADPLFTILNASMADVAAAAQARFADPFPIFNPQGDINAETQSICTLTLLCTDDPDGHPSDAGYQALADVVFLVSDYARLLE
jgi:lysophospholipase L1-like esterase